MIGRPDQVTKQPLGRKSSGLCLEFPVRLVFHWLIMKCGKERFTGWGETRALSDPLWGDRGLRGYRFHST